MNVLEQSLKQVTAFLKREHIPYMTYRRHGQHGLGQVKAQPPKLFERS